MKIYIGHSTGFDFIKELYEPLKNSYLWQDHQIVLPHDTNIEPVNSREAITYCDLMIAEVSYPSIGLGIELGWADSVETPVLCLYSSKTKPSASLFCVFQDFIEYMHPDYMVSRITQWLDSRFCK